MKKQDFEKQVTDAVKFINEADFLKRQSEGITQIKKSHAAKNLGLSIVLIVIGVLLTIYGIADVFTDLKLPMGVIFLVGGPVLVVLSLNSIYQSSVRLANVNQISFASDLDELCRIFYTNALCKRTTDSTSKVDQLKDVCQCVPLPVLIEYSKKELDEDRVLPDGTFATISGWEKLSRRWLKLRGSLTKEDIDFSLSSIIIERTLRSDSNIIDIQISLTGSPFRSATFLNAAFNFEGKWFLASPEPWLFDTQHAVQKERRLSDNVKNRIVQDLAPTSNDNDAVESMYGQPEMIGNQDTKLINPVPVDNGILSFNLGIETLGHVFTTLVSAGEPIPIEHKETFTTSSKNQTEVEINVLYGESSKASECTSLGKYKLNGIPLAPQGVPQIEVTFYVKPNAEFELNAIDRENGKAINVLHE